MITEKKVQVVKGCINRFQEAVRLWEEKKLLRKGHP